MRQRVRMLALAWVLAFGPGCFVIDELDSGLAEMKAVSPNGRKDAPAEAEEAPEAEARSGSAPRRDLAKWWKSARTPSSGPRDPSTATEVVSCRIGGGVRFMSKTDCQVQGGNFQ